MIRMSRQAWNNVLIFSMLIMIALFNGLHKKLSPEPVLTQVPLLPEHSLLLTIKFGDTQIERIGQTWRANPAIGLDEHGLSQLMDVWLQYQADLAPDAHEPQVLTQGTMPKYFVIATLAGKSDGAVYAFYPQLEQVLVHDQMQGRWLHMPVEDLSLLFPQVITPNH